MKIVHTSWQWHVFRLWTHKMKMFYIFTKLPFIVIFNRKWIICYLWMFMWYQMNGNPTPWSTYSLFQIMHKLSKLYNIYSCPLNKNWFIISGYFSYQLQYLQVIQWINCWTNVMFEQISQQLVLSVLHVIIL